jgi:hypothetical protein
MKKQVLFLFVVIALLASLVPGTVLAGKPTELKVFVHNNTGGEVQLQLEDANGNFQWMTLVAGVSTVMVTEGKYSYYAVTPCGPLAGNWNLNVSKQLNLSCTESGATTSFAKRCGHNWFGRVWYDSVNGIHLYVEGDYINIPDAEYFEEYLYGEFGYFPEWHTYREICFSDFKEGGETSRWDTPAGTVFYYDYEWIY